MSARYRRIIKGTIQILNLYFWLASIGLWLWIVGRSEIWSADFTSKFFWINFLFFLAAGLGVAATTHFSASALPLALGIMAVTAQDIKGGWMWLSLYIVAAAVIGLFAGIIKLSAYLNTMRSGRIDGDS